MKKDKTRKSKIYEQQNPYKFQTQMGRDTETALRHRRGDFGNKAQKQDEYPDTAFPARDRTISIG